MEKNTLKNEIKEINAFLKHNNFKEQANIRKQISRGNYQKAAETRSYMEMLSAILNCEKTKRERKLREM